ncbi:MAG: UvrD-helicase domain-containing protein, partial [Clostridiales bacterium]|nr:UvrD-helicase domain-containing protein [Candidatus Apopatocola equi]
CAAYAKRLREADAMNFDDLIYYAVILLRDNADVREYYQNKFRYVLVDEYQDTSHLQYELTRLLSGGQRNLCVVGDDDQSIYKFRGATIENILSFQKEYPEARVIRLEQNYRSSGNILEAANAVIANNTERMGKNLWTQAGKGEPLYEYVAMSEDDEADFVARTIQQSGRSPKDFAILYRTNAQSRIVEQVLKRRKISYRIFGGTRFFDRAEVKDVLAYLCTVANPTDETRLLRILNNPPRGIGAAGVERAQALAAREGRPLFDILRNAALFPELGRSAGRMQEFADMITGLQNDLAEGMPLDEFFDKLIDKSGYVRALEEKHSDEELARIENVQELKSSIVKTVEENDGGDLYQYLDDVALYSDLDNYDENAECCSLMTMHSAKGLEFPVVFLIGADDGLFPSALAIGDHAEMEEERRLCYVAITRAKERLYICEASQRMLYGRTNSYVRSRFIDEIPPELLETHSRSAQRREESMGADPYAVRRKAPSHSYGSSTVRITPQRSVAKPKTTLASPTVPDFKAGDTVEHKSFGKGVLLKLTPMGGDALVEIEFESVGVKKLMLRVAAQHMTKL